MPSIISAAILASAWSGGNTFTLFGSRILFGMAMQEYAPAFFARLNRFRVPYAAITFFGAFMCLGYMIVSGHSRHSFWLVAGHCMSLNFP